LPSSGSHNLKYAPESPRRLAALALAGAVFSGPAIAAVPPFTNAENAVPASIDERRLWWSGDEAVEFYARSGRLYSDDTATAYVQAVVDRLFPEFKGKMIVHLLKSSDLNAFVLPNGHVFVNIGLLARFENEAQLATVLGHEGTHFTHRHSLREQNQAENATGFASVVGIVGIPARAVAASSILGYSRDMETEADTVGFRRLAAASYDVHEAPKVFEHLMRDIKAEDIQAPYFFSTHPKLQDRRDNMNRLSAREAQGSERLENAERLPANRATAAGGTSKAEYTAAMAKIRVDNLEALLSMDRAKQALIMLEEPERLADLPPSGSYYLGEAYRRRGDPGDLALAEQAYQKAVEAAPDFAPSYRALGMLALQAKKWSEAQTYFERYLALMPEAKDRKYVESYMKIAKEKAASQ
jgi:beta-barrel assembly-enhancing protease